jgi:DNA-binding MarR family transcriptional regulator
MAVVTSVMRVQQILVARANAALRPLGLTFARYEILMLLLFSRRGLLPLGKIGERLQVNAASVTSAVGRLERDGLVTKVPNPIDSRGTLARITRNGRLLARRATTRINAQVFADLGMDTAHLNVLFEALRTLRVAAGDFDQAGPTTPA